MMDVAPRLMEYLERRARGRRNAVPRDVVLRYLRPWDPTLDDRSLRKLYASLPICTTAKGASKGLFLPASAEEIEAFRKELFEKVPGPQAQARYRIVLQAYPQFTPPVGKQLDLYEWQP